MQSVHTSVALLVAVLVLVGVYAYFSGTDGRLSSSDSTSMLPSGDELATRTIVDFGTATDGVVAYSYLGDPVSEKLADNEVTELRNETSYTTLIEAPQKEGDDATLQTIIYSQPAFAQDVNGQWKYLEYATTTEQAFRDRDRSLWQALIEVLVHTAYADTASPFSGAGDGYVYRGNSGFVAATQFSSARTAGSGSTASPSATSADTLLELYTIDCEGGCTYFAYIYRSFLPFDTSSIPSDATVSAVSLSVYVTSTWDATNDSYDYITVSTSTQATHTTLTTADYNDAGPTTMNSTAELVSAGNRKDLTSISSSAYLTFDLDADGIAAVKVSGSASTCSATNGITCLALREGHDATGNAPTIDAGANGIEHSTSEATGTSQDPYLTVTYTSPSSGVVIARSMKVGGAGTLKVTSGGIILK
jgi:hypothetical protein